MRDLFFACALSSLPAGAPVAPSLDRDLPSREKRESQHSVRNDVAAWNPCQHTTPAVRVVLVLLTCGPQPWLQHHATEACRRTAKVDRYSICSH